MCVVLSCWVFYTAEKTSTGSLVLSFWNILPPSLNPVPLSRIISKMSLSSISHLKADGLSQDLLRSSIFSLFLIPLSHMDGSGLIVLQALLCMFPCRSPWLHMSIYITHSFCLIRSLWLLWSHFPGPITPPTNQFPSSFQRKAISSISLNFNETPALDLWLDFSLALNPSWFPQLTKHSHKLGREYCRLDYGSSHQRVQLCNQLNNGLTIGTMEQTALRPSSHQAPGHLFTHLILKCRKNEPCLNPHPGHNKPTSLYSTCIH